MVETGLVVQSTPRTTSGIAVEKGLDIAKALITEPAFQMILGVVACEALQHLVVRQKDGYWSTEIRRVRKWVIPTFGEPHWEWVDEPYLVYHPAKTDYLLSQVLATSMETVIIASTALKGITGDGVGGIIGTIKGFIS